MIKRAIEKDIPEIAKVEINSGYKFNRFSNINEEIERIKEDFKTGRNFFVLIHKNEIVGYFSLFIKKNICEFEYLAILKKYHGKGFGKKLMKFQENYAKKKGCGLFRLEVNNKNLNAIGLYIKFGYIIKKIIKRGKSEKLIMEKKVKNGRD